MIKHISRTLVFAAFVLTVSFLGAPQVQAVSLFDAKTELLRDAQTKKIYAVIGGVRHHLANVDILRSYAYRLLELKDVTAEALAKFDAVRLIKSSLGPRVYFVDQATGQKVWYPTEESFLGSGEKWEKIVSVSGDDSRSMKNGHLVKTANSADIYYLDFDALTRSLIPSPDVFAKAGFSSSNVLTVPEPLLLAYRLTDSFNPDTLPLPPAPDVPPSAEALSVSITPTSIAASIPSGTTRNELANIVFKAGRSSASVTALTLTRHGFLVDRDISSLLLFDDNGFSLTRPQQLVNSSVSFAFSEPLVVPANQERRITLSVNFASTLSTSNQGTLSFTIESPTAITASNVAMTGVFPLTTKTFTVLSTTALIGSLSVDTVQISSGARDIRVGDKDQDLNRFKLSVVSGRESVSLARMLFTAVGNADLSDFANIKLLDNRNKTVAISASANGRSVALRFTSPYKILSGETKELVLRGDVVSGSDSSVQFIIENDYDVYAKGDNYGFAIATRSAANAGNFPIGSTSLTGQNAIHIVGGSVAASLSANSPTGPLTKGADSMVLATIDIRPSGQNLRWDRVTVAVATTVPHTALRGPLLLRLLKGGSVATIDADSVTDRQTAVYLSNPPVLMANKTYTYELVGNVSNTVSATDSYQINFSDFRFTLSNEAKTVTFAGPIAGSVRPTREISLFVRNDPRFTDAVSPAGRLRTKVGRLLFQASPGEDIRIDEVVLEAIGTTPVSFDRGFSNLKLGGITLASPSGGLYRFPLKIIVGANREYGVDLLVDSSFLSDGSVSQFKISSITAFGRTSGASITATFGNNETPTVTFKRTALTIAADPNFTGGTLVPGKNLSVAGFVITASGAEDVQINGLTFIEAAGSSGLAVTRGYTNMRLVDAETNRLRSSTLRSPISGAGGNRLTGPTLAPNQRMALRVVVDATTAVAGDTIQLLLSSIETVGRDSRLAASVTGLPLTSSGVSF
ncbi:MAG: hypothetical protein WC817_03720 [Patescibacteria group bacterium]|jgi:hypothetical protein